MGCVRVCRGAWAVWQFAALHPNVFTAVCGLSVPYSPTKTVSDYIDMFGDPFKPEAEPNFFYMVRAESCMLGVWLSVGCPSFFS